MAKRSAKKNEYQSAEQVGVIYASIPPTIRKKKALNSRFPNAAISPQRTESGSSESMRIRPCLAAPIGARISSA